MNLRYFVGSTFNLAFNNILSNQAFPLTRYIPHGQSVFYDIQRFSKKKKLDTLFNIGANVGQTANGLVRYFPKSQIYCFEPVSMTFNILFRKFSKKRSTLLVAQEIFCWGKQEGIVFRLTKNTLSTKK